VTLLEDVIPSTVPTADTLNSYQRLSLKGVTSISQKWMVKLGQPLFLNMRAAIRRGNGSCRWVCDSSLWPKVVGSRYLPDRFKNLALMLLAVRLPWLCCRERCSKIQTVLCPFSRYIFFPFNTLVSSCFLSSDLGEVDGISSG
jgi:hypothetical protein